MMFIPAHAPYDYYTKEYEKGLQLYTNGVLIMEKCGEKMEETLFVEPINASIERWVGKKMTKEEAKEISGIEKVDVINNLSAVLNQIMNREEFSYNPAADASYQAYSEKYRNAGNLLPSFFKNNNSCLMC